MPVPILLYHHIGQAPAKGTPSRSNYVTPEKFARQMQWLQRIGYRGVSLKEGIPYITGEKQGKVAVITFDDGFVSVYDHAMPVLNQLGFTATNFFVCDEIAGYNRWDKPAAARAQCMDMEQIRQWVKNGHEAGSHAMTHPHLADIALEDAEREIVRSKEILERDLGINVVSFAYPYGSENADIRAIVEAAGYQYGVTTRRGRVKGNEDPYELPRHSVRRNDNIIQFLLKCLVR